jgi:hypothetical protein
MAENKKSFVAYCDWIESFEELTDEEAGRLVKHMFRYVNDLDPEAPDKLIKMMFIPIKQSLKRDLIKYEDRADRSRENGKLGGRPNKPKEPSGLINNPTEPKEPDSVNVSVSVNDSVNDSDSVNVTKPIIIHKPVFSFKKSLLDLGVEEPHLSDWLKVRKEKKSSNTQTALTTFLNQVNESNLNANECVKLCAGHSWAGFKNEWLTNQTTNGKQTNKNNGLVQQLSKTDAWRDM